MKRFFVFLYGLMGYLLFFAVFLYWIGFMINQWVPKSIDSGQSSSILQAFIIDLLLISLFGLQHSIMARRSFKHWLGKFMPKSMIRSTFVIVSSAVLALIFWQWKPISLPVWNIEAQIGRGIMFGLFGLGWGILVLSTYLINHFELFGLQQVYSNLRNKEFREPHFQTPLLYKIVRHPMMVGVIIAIFATPEMTIGHLLFAVGMSTYVLIGVVFEERDLVRSFGNRYRKYQSEVPKLIPVFARKDKKGEPVEAN
jgi:protein-S-isoprenylcysteine O-methyltransferase Ste14